MARLLAAVLLVALAAPGVRAQTVSPSSFDPSRRDRDEAILRRVKDRVSVMSEPGEAPRKPPLAASFRVPFGEFATEESWLIDPLTGEDVLRGRVSFTPSAECPACREIRMVQIARVEKKAGLDIDWGNGQESRNLMRTPDGYFVDHDALKCAPGKTCSPYFRDSWPNPDESADGGSAPPPGSPASLVDYPFGWTYFERISLETCARCVDTGKFLGCATWGGTWPETGDRTLRESAASAAPSPTFIDALRRFETFYSPR